MKTSESANKALYKQKKETHFRKFIHFLLQRENFFNIYFLFFLYLDSDFLFYWNEMERI